MLDQDNNLFMYLISLSDLDTCLLAIDITWIL